MKAYLIVNASSGSSTKIQLQDHPAYIYQERGEIRVSLTPIDPLLAEIRQQSNQYVFAVVHQGIAPTFKNHKFRLKKLNHGDEVKLGSTSFVYLQDDLTAPITTPPDPPIAALMIVSGPCKGKKISLDNKILYLGREPVDDHPNVAMNDQFVSQDHCRIEPRGTGYAVVDLNSKNGTYVNGTRIQEHQLTNGDDLQIGLTVLKFMSPQDLGVLDYLASSKVLALILVLLIAAGLGAIIVFM